MGLGIFRDFGVERGRELVLLFGGSIWVLIGLYSKGYFLTERAEMGNRCLMEGTIGGLSDKF